MKRAAGRKSTTNADSDINQYMEALEAKQQFIGATLNMSWRMALTVIIPIVAGVKLDQRFNSEPSWTLVGFMIGAAGACAAVWSTVKELNQLQADADKEKKIDDE